MRHREGQGMTERQKNSERKTERKRDRDVIQYQKYKEIQVRRRFIRIQISLNFKCLVVKLKFCDSYK